MSSTDRLVPPRASGAAVADAASAASSLRGHRYGEDALYLLVRDPGTVLALWELTPATGSAAAARAAAARAAVRYQIHIERAAGDAETAETVASADLPDAVGGEAWYVVIPPRAGRCRARLGLDVNGRFETILISRWVATPPDGPCDRVAPWPLGEGGEAWAAREGVAARGTSSRGLSSYAARFLPPPAKAATTGTTTGSERE